MRSGVPWSVKGIEPEAREAAKQAARRAGVTLGAWLNQVIMDGGTDEVGMPDLDLPPHAQPATFAPQTPSSPAVTYGHAAPQQNYAPQQQPQVERVAIDMAPVAEAVRDIVSRVEQSERRTQDLARRMEQSVGMIAERLEQSERHVSERLATERQIEDAMPDPRTFDPLERKIAQLAERLEVAERGRAAMGRKGFDDYKTQIQTLEKAVNAVVDHLEAAERRSDESLLEIRQTLSAVAGRVDDREQQEAREEAAARARAMDETMLMLAQRLEKMESSVSNVGGQAVDAALKAIAEKNDAERHKQTLDSLQHHLTEITHRLERAEKRTDDTLKTFEITVTGIARKLEELDHNQDQQLAHEVDARLEEMANRLHQSEEISMSATQTIERAIAGMSDSLNLSENRSRETIDNLNVMLERMTDRLGRIERETKATRSSVTQTIASGVLSPQLGAGLPIGGLGGGAGYVPGGQTFPIPNFDAPSLGGGYNPIGEFRSPDAGEPYRAEYDAPMSHVNAAADSGADGTPPPPPFAPSDEGDRIEPRLSGGSHNDDEVVDVEELVTAHSEGTARAANDFMAAARRAAQAASISGRNGPQPVLGPNGYAAGYAGASRYNAAEEAQARKKKILFGALAAVVTAVIAIGAVRMLNEEPQIVSVAPVTVTETPGTNDAAPADMGASTEVTSTAPVSTTVPAGPSRPEETTAAAISKTPEATPEGADTKPEAVASAPDTSSPATSATATPVARPKPAKQSNIVTDGPAITPGPTVNSAPTKPVASAPVTSAAPGAERDLRAAAVAGNAAAQYEVGQRYANGENVPQDLAQAAYWYGLSADQGLAISQYRLAALYEKGRGVTQDNAKARDLYEKAAKKGNVKAMHNLAVIYAEGRGTGQDFTMAARWFTAAADYGLGDSQYNLAILQERGLGVTQDLVLAYKWLAIAAAGGDKGAAQKRDEIASKLDAAKLARAKVAVETWSAKHPDPVANGDLSGMGSWASSTISDDGEITASIAPATSAVVARNDIGRAQAMLIKLGYAPGSSDGLMGPRTRDAIVQYQRSAGLDQTGSVNPALLKSLEIATH
ncbi:MAG: peptidoglycan-binding protein [Parvibaculum sp.]|nr:peptidoglycan-binding protein [Parvibaculum sp.]